MKPRQAFPFFGFGVTTSILAAALLVGCASSAGITPIAKLITPSTSGLDGAVSVGAPAVDWWRSYGDDTLNQLMERALSGSPTLKIAQARVMRAAAMVGSVSANDGVQVNGVVESTRERFSGKSIYPNPIGGSLRTLSTAQINASWELDFFGRNKSAIEAAIGQQRAAQAETAAARGMLTSAVARSYIQLGRLALSRQVATDTLVQREQILALIKQRVASGLDTTVDLRQGEGALPEIRVQIEQIDEQLALARNVLAQLTAQAPSALSNLSVSLSALKALKIPTSLPIDLLGRRADIVAARWRIEATTSEMQNAKAQFYPNVNLTSFVGLQSLGLDRLINTGAAQYGVTPAIRLPIFDSGRLRANLKGKAADVDIAIESYNSAVFEAVREASDQITVLQSIARQQSELVSAVTAAESGYTLALQRYKAGIGTYLTVLNTETSIFNLRRQAAELEARTLDTQIALIRALGGGYLSPTQF